MTVVCTGDVVWLVVSHSIYYPIPHIGTVQDIKPAPYGIVSYLIDGQWYSDLELMVYYPEPLDLLHKIRSVRTQYYPLVHQPRISTLSNGTEYDMWMYKNCSDCSKYNPDACEEDEFNCEIEYAISLSYFTGKIEFAIATRMGLQPYEVWGTDYKSRGTLCERKCTEFKSVLKKAGGSR